MGDQPRQDRPPQGPGLKGNFSFVLHVHLHSTAAWHGVLGGQIRGCWLKDAKAGIELKLRGLPAGLLYLYMNMI